MLHIPAFPAGEPQSRLYQVTANGEALPLHSAYVSAMPYNRRWPGYQRSVDQREEAAFALFCTDGPVEMTVRPAAPFTTAVVRPLSLGVQPRIEDGLIRFTLPRPAYCTVEVDGQHHALHLFCDPAPTCTVSPDDPDVLYFGPGVHEAGMITLSTGQTLYIAEDAVVYGSVQATNAQHIRILGRGILDNSHNVETILWPVPADGSAAGDMAVKNALREHTIQLDHCSDIVIDGITMRDSLVYNISPMACRDLVIQHVKLIGNWRYNSDGIDMHNCLHTRISDCFVRTFDDCICAKGCPNHIDDSDRSFDVFRDLVIERCVLWNDWNNALEIGAETRADEMCDIVWRDCDIIHATTAFLDIMNVHHADVHDVTIEDIRCEYDDPAMQPLFQHSDSEPYQPHYEKNWQPKLFSACIAYHPEYSISKERRGRIRRITLKNITINTDAAPLVRLTGFDATHGCDDITMDGIWRNGQRLSAADIQLTQNQFVNDFRFV